MPRTPVVSSELKAYAVRIHQVEGVTDARIQEFFRKMDGPYLLVRETEAARTHYQGWCLSGVAPVTLRGRLKKAFPECVGNKGYSLSEGDETFDRYQRYCMKGARDVPPEVVARSDRYDDAWVQAEWLGFWADEKAEAYELKKSKLTVTERIWARVDEAAAQKAPTVNLVARIIVEEHTKAAKPFDVFQVRRLRNTIMSKYNKEFRKRFLQEVNSDDLGTAFQDDGDYREAMVEDI